MDADEGAYGRVKLWVWGPFNRAGMNETVFPDVTTSLLVCGESSIDVIGPGKVRLVVSVRVRRSHHLSAGEVFSAVGRAHKASDMARSYLISPSSPADTPVWSPTQTTLFTVPSCERPLPPSKRMSGSASGRPRSNILTFFSCPPVRR